MQQVLLMSTIVSMKSQHNKADCKHDDTSLNFKHNFDI